MNSGDRERRLIRDQQVAGSIPPPACLMISVPAIRPTRCDQAGGMGSPPIRRSMASAPRMR